MPRWYTFKKKVRLVLGPVRSSLMRDGSTDGERYRLSWPGTVVAQTNHMMSCATL